MRFFPIERYGIIVMFGIKNFKTTIMEMQRGEIYVIQTEKTEYICVFDRLEYNKEINKHIYFDYFCVDCERGMKVLCNDLPIAIDPLTIRVANKGERDIFFRRIRAELLEYKLTDVVKYENDDAGQEEGNG